MRAEGLWVLRGESAGLEPMRRSDETKIEKRALGMCACARLRPRLLFSARAGKVDANANARAGGEIERGDLCRST